MGLFGSKPDPIATRVAAARTRMRQQGHELSPLQEGIVGSLAASASDQPDIASALSDVRLALEANDCWSEVAEWRISTWCESDIARFQRDGRTLYRTTVKCDGQSLSCEGPSLERVFAFMRLYQAIISQGFYAAGPPWAE